MLTDCAPASGAEFDDSGLIDTPRAWAAVAALYEVPEERVVAAARQAATAHENLGLVFTPLEPWWNALGVTYPVELGAPDRTVETARL